MSHTIAEARYIMSGVFCVSCLPWERSSLEVEGGGLVYAFSHGYGMESLCARCPCRNPADLRLYVASERDAHDYIDRYESAIRAPRRFHPLLDSVPHDSFHEKAAE